jgi:hypothetical protein
MFEKDNHVISYALNGWANWIETHDMSVSSADALKMKQTDLLRPLSHDQMKFVVRLRELSNEYFNKK